MAEETVETVEQTAATPDNQSSEQAPETPGAAETTPAATEAPAAPEKKPGWDHERQKRDEARAAREREIQEKLDAQAAEIAELKKSLQAKPPPIPTADELQAMAEDVAKLSDPANAAYDPDAARVKDIAWRKATAQRQKVLDEKLTAYERDTQARADEARWWSKWKQDHPDCDLAKAKQIAEEALDKHSTRYSGNALSLRALEELESRLDETRKAPPQTPRPKPKTTAPAPSASAPAGTQVVPASSGARPQPADLKEAHNILARAMRAMRGQ